jgi:hypothetical protein
MLNKKTKNDLKYKNKKIFLNFNKIKKEDKILFSLILFLCLILFSIFLPNNFNNNNYFFILPLIFSFLFIPIRFVIKKLELKKIRSFIKKIEGRDLDEVVNRILLLCTSVIYLTFIFLGAIFKKIGYSTNIENVIKDSPCFLVEVGTSIFKGLFSIGNHFPTTSIIIILLVILIEIILIIKIIIEIFMRKQIKKEVKK